MSRTIHARVDDATYDELKKEAETRGLELNEVIRERLDPKSTSTGSPSRSATSSAPISTPQDDPGPAGTVYEVQETHSVPVHRILVTRSEWIGLPDKLKAAKARNDLLNAQLAVERQRNSELRTAAAKRTGQPRTGDYRCRVENCPVATASFVTYEALLAHQREVHPERFVR